MKSDLTTFAKVVEELLSLFIEANDRGQEHVSGREIIERLELADQEYLDSHDKRRIVPFYINTPEIQNFFESFCYGEVRSLINPGVNFSSIRVLEVNPGEEVISGIWIRNRYGLRPEWRREIKLRSLLENT